MWNPVWTWTTTILILLILKSCFVVCIFFHFGKIAIFLNILSLFFKDFSTKISSSTATVDCIHFFSNFGIHWTTKPTYCASTTSSKCKCCHKSRFSNIFFRFFLYFFSVKNSEYCLVGDIMPSPSVAHWLSLIVSVENFQKVQY